MVLSIWCLRDRSKKVNDLQALYGGEDNYFSLKIYYSGIFTKAPGRKYIDGTIAFFDYIDTDLFSVHDLDDMVRDLGYQSEQSLYYHFCIPDFPLDYGLMPLGNDDDVRKLVSYVPKHRLIMVYIESGMTRVPTYFKSPSKVVIEELESENVSPELTRRRPSKREAGSCSKKIDLDVDLGNLYSKSIVLFRTTQDSHESVESYHVDLNFQSQPYPTNQTEGVVQDTDVDLNDFDPFLEDYSVMGEFDAEYNQEGTTAVEESVGIVQEESDEECSDEANQENSEDDDYFVEKSKLLYDVDVDMSEFYNVVDEDEHGILNSKNKSAGGDIGDELQVVVTDDYEFAGFEEDARKRMLKDLSMPSKCSHGEVHKKAFRVGQIFKSKVNVKNFINLHSVQSRRALYLAKNDKIRIRVKCKGVVGQSDESGGNGKIVINKKGICPWAVQISRATVDEHWMVKTVIDEHKCLKTRAVKACTAKFLANDIVDQIQGNPRIPLKALHEQLSKKFELGLSRQKVARAKTMAEHIINGDFQAQYAYLRDYCMEVLNTNPGSTIRVDVYPEPNLSCTTRTFRRVYVCLGALKVGFKAGLRDFLGVDGTFMKGPYPGQVLTAVGLDSNNGIYPVAYAVVEAETTSSWTWFLELLGEDLDLGPQSNFTFISDRQKGIIPAIPKVFPNAEHRYCLRHIMDNMKLQWKGDDLRDHVWKCGRATTINHFNSLMDDLKKMNDKAHAWLCQIPASHWAKSHFSGRAHSDCLLNNLCEVFNGKIDDGRDKPIITCLEYIRQYLMKRFCVVQKAMDKCHGLLTPSATQLFDDIKGEASQYKAIFNGAGKYQVCGPWQDQFVVNLNDKTCTCRAWEITGLPCKHDVCAIWDKIENGEVTPQVEDWVHPCYRLSTWKAMYLNKIEPINGRSMWPKSNCPYPLNPPKHHKQVGRPKKKRKKGVDETTSQPTKLSRRYVSVTCAKCHNKGHSARTCKGQGELVNLHQFDQRGRNRARVKELELLLDSSFVGVSF